MRRFTGLLLCFAAAAVARHDPSALRHKRRDAQRATLSAPPGPSRAEGIPCRWRRLPPPAIATSATSRSSRMRTASSCGRTSSISTARRCASRPLASGYRYAVLDGGYDAAAAAPAAPVVALDDDDSRPVALPFAFPFFGVVLPRPSSEFRRQPDVRRAGHRLQRALARTHDRRSAAHLAAFRRPESRRDRGRCARAERGGPPRSELGRGARVGIGRHRRATDVPGRGSTPTAGSSSRTRA